MNRKKIIQLRLFNQGLSADCFEKPAEVVAHFGAMQAQDYSMALWAIGLRIKSPNRIAIEKLINSGKIIRTHILRPTWHLVHQKDIRWMMELSAPHVKKATQYVDKKEGLTDELFLKAWKIIEKQFRDDDNLTKEDIMYCLSKKKITVGNLLATQIIIRAELEMLLCNGEKKGTYALLDKQLACFTFNDLNYYHFETEDNIPPKNTFALLPCYDEYTVGYSEGRDIVLPTDLDNSKIGNGIFKPIILSGNEIAGTWRKSKKSPFVELETFTGKEIKTVNVKKHIEKINSFSS